METIQDQASGLIGDTSVTITILIQKWAIIRQAGYLPLDFPWLEVFAAEKGHSENEGKRLTIF